MAEVGAVNSSSKTYSSQTQNNVEQNNNELSWLKYTGLFPYAAITAAEWAKENPQKTADVMDTFCTATMPAYAVAKLVNSDENKAAENNEKPFDGIKKNFKTAINILCPITNLFG